MNIISVGSFGGINIYKLTTNGTLEKLNTITKLPPLPITNIQLQQTNPYAVISSRQFTTIPPAQNTNNDTNTFDVSGSASISLPPVLLLCQCNAAAAFVDATTDTGFLLAQGFGGIPCLSPHDGDTAYFVGSRDVIAVEMRNPTNPFGFPVDIGERSLTCTNVSSDGKLLAIGGAYTPICVVDIASKGTVITRLGDNKARVWGCAFAPNCKRLAAVASTSHLLIFDVDTASMVKKIKLSYVAWTCQFSPVNPSHVVVSSPLGPFEIWDIETGASVLQMREEKQQYQRNLRQYCFAKYTKDGTRVITNNSNNANHVSVWCAQTGRNLFTLETEFPVCSVDVSHVKHRVDWHRALLVLLGHLKGDADECPFAWTPSLAIRVILSFITILPFVDSQMKEKQKEGEEEEEEGQEKEKEHEDEVAEEDLHGPLKVFQYYLAPKQDSDDEDEEYDENDEMYCTSSDSD